MIVADTLWRRGARPDALSGSTLRAYLPHVAIGELCEIWPTTVARQEPAYGVVTALTPYIDAHAHLDPDDPNGSVQAALHAESVGNAAKILFLALP